jgi:hypothetical protein
MRSHCICERTAVSTNDYRVGSFFNFRESAESGENGSGSFGSLTEGSSQRGLIRSESFSDIA